MTCLCHQHAVERIAVEHRKLHDREGVGVFDGKRLGADCTHAVGDVPGRSVWKVEPPEAHLYGDFP